MARRSLVIALFTLTLGPIPIVGWLGWRTIESLRDSVASLANQRLEESLAGDLATALAAPDSPIPRATASFAITAEDAPAIAVAEEPTARFLADPLLMRARVLARRGES